MDTQTKIDDFVSLFNVSWYRDFPIASGHEALGKPAVWTNHIGFVVKRCADFFGYFTCFESGGRTDAVIQTVSGKVWARIEWEWRQPYHRDVNEIKKLAKASDDAELLVFIGYSKTKDHEKNIQAIQKVWSSKKKPLLVFLVKYQWHPGRRRFDSLQTHYFEGNKHKAIRKQPALPWEVRDTVWQKMSVGKACIKRRGR